MIRARRGRSEPGKGETMKYVGKVLDGYGRAVGAGLELDDAGILTAILGQE